MENRIGELKQGKDLAWDTDFSSSAAATAQPICDLTESEQAKNSSGQTCGQPLELQDQSTSDERKILLKRPTGVSLEKSYRLGAWTHSMRYFKDQITAELGTQKKIRISAECAPLATEYQQSYDSISALKSGRDGGIKESTVASAHKRVEAAFVQVAACETRARATAVDREVFLPHSACGDGQKVNLSPFNQVLEQKFLTQTCEAQATAQCAKESACLAGRSMDLTDSSCWKCTFPKIKTCYQTQWQAFLKSPGSSNPLGPGFPETLRTWRKPASPVPSKIHYQVESDGCTGTSDQRGCPNVATPLFRSALRFVLDGLNDDLEAAKEMESAPEPGEVATRAEAAKEEPVIIEEIVYTKKKHEGP